MEKQNIENRGALLVLVKRILSGRIKYLGENIGKTIIMEAGGCLEVFRDIKVVPCKDAPGSPSVFRVTFRFRNFPQAFNRRLSLIPVPFLLAMPGFCQKLWTVDRETGEFQGLYQWATLEAAHSYPDSFIFRLMTKRAAPGSVAYEIIPQTTLDEHLMKSEREGDIR